MSLYDHEEDVIIDLNLNLFGGSIYNGRSDKTPYRQFWR